MEVYKNYIVLYNLMRVYLIIQTCFYCYSTEMFVFARIGEKMDIFSRLFRGESLLYRPNRELIIFMVLGAIYIIEKIVGFFLNYNKK